MKSRKDRFPKPASAKEVEIPQVKEVKELENLEQHISQRIMSLGEDTTSFAVSTDEPAGFPFAQEGVLPAFEEEKSFELPLLDAAQQTYANLYQAPAFSASPDLTKGLNDITDQLTKSVLNLNCRLSTLEENLCDRLQSNNQELKKILNEMKTLINTARVQAAPPVAAANTQTDSLDLTQKLQSQMKLLEATIELSAQELRQGVDEKQNITRDYLEQKLRVIDRDFGKNRQYFNRHFLSLSVLLTILVFIGGALVTMSLDRISNYIVQQIDALHVELQSQGNPKPNDMLDRGALAR